MTQKTHSITSMLNKFRSELNVPEKDNAALLGARNATRKFLNDRLIPGLRAVAKSANLEEIPQGAEIKFLTQGSFIYRTLNFPAHIPPQQMDLDDGIYFRASDVQMLQPWMLLDVMGSILGEWAKRNGWKPVPKSNCCRMVLPATNGGSENKHIDWPLYAIRDDQMGNLEKHNLHKAKYSATYEEWTLPYHRSVDKVWLACREGWDPSDPRQVIDWVADEKEKYGAAFANVCRYIKAWRDYQWPKSSLTSITIMAIVADAFKAAVQVNSKEDDLLLHATGHIKTCLLSGVYAPFDSSEQLDKNIEDEERGDIVNKAAALYEAIRRVMYGGLSPGDICTLMRMHFGDRWPMPPTVKPPPPPPPPPPRVTSVPPRKQWCN